MIKPFLQWAGGKSRIAKRIKEILPKGKRLIEPFVGSGAVFMNMDYEDYLLADINPDLINLFQHLKDESNEFIEYAGQYFTPENNTKTAYIELRTLFNTTQDTRLKSALLIYLNRHCFGAMCRYNGRGEFNNSFGNQPKPKLPKNEMLVFSEKSKQARFIVADFKSTMDQAQVGDVVYCDPPYVKPSTSPIFTDYSPIKFSMNDQQALADYAIKLSKKGIPVLISNHVTEWTLSAYRNADITEFEVKRSISCDSRLHSKVPELLAFFNSQSKEIYANK
jgi:DNA adenine methylase